MPLDLKSLRAALWARGLCSEDDLGEGAAWAVVKLSQGASIPTAVWRAVREVSSGRSVVNGADLKRWGCERVKLKALEPSEVARETSRELDPVLCAVISEELQTGAVSV